MSDVVGQIGAVVVVVVRFREKIVELIKGRGTHARIVLMPQIEQPKRKLVFSLVVGVGVEGEIELELELELEFTVHCQQEESVHCSQ